MRCREQAGPNRLGVVSTHGWSGSEKSLKGTAGMSGLVAGTRDGRRRVRNEMNKDGEERCYEQPARSTFLRG